MNGALRRLSKPLVDRLTSPASSRLIERQSRRYAADAHGDVKVNFWQAPTNISSWKEEHIVLAVLGTWGVVIYTALKTFGGKKEEAIPAQQ